MIVSSINGVGKIGYSHAKEWNWTHILHHTQKPTWNGLNVRPESVKLLEENIEGKLLDTGFGDDVLDLALKAKVTKAKINKWDYIKLKSYYIARKPTTHEKATY